MTETVIADGADIVFGLGDGASFGMIQAVESADGVRFIDFIGDKTANDDSGIILTSVLYDFQPIFKGAVDAVNEGTSARRRMTSIWRTEELLSSRQTTSTTRPGMSPRT